jgi:hypothetical protein
MFKKLVAIAMASAMTVAMAVSAFAATGISTEEQKVLDYLKEAGVPTSYIAQAEEVFMNNTTDITADQAKEAMATIDDAKQIVKDNNITTLEQLKANTTVLNKVVAKANEAAKEVGYTETIKVTVKDSNGKTTVLDGSTTVVDNSTPNDKSAVIANAGVDFSTTATVVAGLGLSVAGVAIASKKRVSVNA